MTPRNMRKFLFFKLPLAYFAGIRVKSISVDEVISTVKHRWINQNPYKSMFWAVQGMAAELTTGILVTKHVAESGKRISMLVTQQQGNFYKKATGRITFSCKDGENIKNAIRKAIDTKEGQVFSLNSKGFNENGVEVSSFTFEWSVKVK